MVVRERQPQAPERSSPESFLPALEQRWSTAGCTVSADSFLETVNAVRDF